MQKSILYLILVISIIFFSNQESLTQKKDLPLSKIDESKKKIETFEFAPFDLIEKTNANENFLSETPRISFINLTLDELNKLNIYYSKGIMKVPMEMRIINNGKLNNKTLLKNGYTPDDDYIRKLFKVSINGIKTQYIKYNGWDKNQCSPLFPIAISTNIYGKSGNKELEIKLFEYNDKSPFIIKNNEVFQKEIEKLIDEFVNKSNGRSLFNKTNSDIVAINYLIPIKTVFTDKIKYRGRMIECNIEYVFWFIPSSELINSLPQKYAQSIINEFQLIDKINNGEISAQEAYDSLNSKESYINVSNYDNSIFSNATIYPNPAITDFSIKFKLKEARVISVHIYELTGQLLSQNLYTYVGSNYIAGENIIPIKLKDVARGVYLISLTTDRGENIILRLVVN